MKLFNLGGKNYLCKRFTVFEGIITYSCNFAIGVEVNLCYVCAFKGCCWVWVGNVILLSLVLDISRDINYRVSEAFALVAVDFCCCLLLVTWERRSRSLPGFPIYVRVLNPPPMAQMEGRDLVPRRWELKKALPVCCFTCSPEEILQGLTKAEWPQTGQWMC